MDRELAALVIKRYGADEWLKPEPRNTNVFVWQFTPSRLQPRSIQQSVRKSDDDPSEVRVTRSTYRKGEALLLLTTYECVSRAAARAELLRVLSEFQGPTLERTDVAGEVAYRVLRDFTIVVARGNLVAIARNGEKKLTSAAALVRRLDKLLTEELPAEERTLTRLRPPAVGEWIRIVAEGGEVELSRGRPVLRGKGTVAVARLR